MDHLQELDMATDLNLANWEREDFWSHHASEQLTSNGHVCNAPAVTLGFLHGAVALQTRGCTMGFDQLARVNSHA